MKENTWHKKFMLENPNSTARKIYNELKVGVSKDQDSTSKHMEFWSRDSPCHESVVVSRAQRIHRQLIILDHTIIQWKWEYMTFLSGCTGAETGTVVSLEDEEDLKTFLTEENQPPPFLPISNWRICFSLPSSSSKSCITIIPIQP